MELWYKNYAKNYNEALPIGNGRLGAMIYGNPDCEKISLNDDTLWSGYPKDKNRENAYKYLPEVRKLIDERSFDKAQKLVEKEMLSTYHENYLPLGNLYIKTGYKDVRNYKRSLSLDNAITTVEYDYDNAHLIAKCFVSYPDDCLVYTFEASDERELSIELILNNDVMSRAEYSSNHNCYYIEGYAPELSPPHYYITDYPTEQGEKGMGFSCVVEPVLGEFFAKEGFDEFHFDNSTLLKGKGKIGFILTSKTGFNGYDKMPSRDILSLRKECRSILSNAKKYDLNELINRHLKDYQALYNRVEFSLFSDENKNPTDERLLENYKTKEDLGLVEAVFDFGRYLTIQGSRKGSRAMNLQGIWNDNVRPPWSSNYTVNINTEMNYWPTEVTNLSECAEPLFNFINEITQKGKITAQKMYKMNGATCHHNVDIWGQTTPVSQDVDGGERWAMWPMALAWFCSHLYEHYLFTNDIEFLRKSYNSIKEATLFLLDWFYEENGVLKSCPSISPENAYVFKGQIVTLSYSSTMDFTIARELFNILIASEDKLSITDGISKKVKKALKMLPNYKIGSLGQLLEYSEDFEESEIHHRHKSHLIGAYPFCDILTSGDKKLIEAVRTSMNRRGDESNGWSLAWKICIWARLKDGNRAEELIQNLLRPILDDKNEKNGGIYNNMFNSHPPFQIDGNFGATAGIAEMLLSSYDNKIEILPSIPDKWKKGYVKGLKARGNITVDINWNEKNISVSLLSNDDKKVTLKIKDDVKEYFLKKGQKENISYNI